MENKGIENIILWGISIFLILSMLVYIGQTTTQAILMGILGILVMPPINRKINEKFINGNKIKNIIKIISEIILFFVIVCSIPTNENTSNSNISNKPINNTISTVSQIDNTIINNENKEDKGVKENNTIGPKEQTNNIQQQKNSENNESNTESTSSINTNSNTTTTKSTVNSSNIKSSSSQSSSGSTNSSSSKTATNKSSTVSSSQTTNVDNSRTVYATPTGKRYHYISTCGGKNSTANTLNKAIARGLTPCQKCTK